VCSSRKRGQREVDGGTRYMIASRWVDRVFLADVRKYVSCAVDNSLCV
jgi:hypothetical protein